jgi:nucleoside phosphorylase
MNGSIGIGRCKGLASLAILLGAFFTISAYAQQDVAPSWYDPWAAPNTAVAHPAQAPAVVHSAPPLVQNRLQSGDKAPAPRVAKLRVKETHIAPTPRNVAYKRTEIPSGN